MKIIIKFEKFPNTEETYLTARNNNPNTKGYFYIYKNNKWLRFNNNNNLILCSLEENTFESMFQWLIKNG